MFDILNGRHPSEATYRRNDDLSPFSSSSDCRLAWLQEECLGYFTDWENSVNMLDLSKQEKERRLLSRQTRAGICVSINGFVEAIRWLLSQPDAPPYILSGVFNQDRLEIYFSHIRGSGGSNDHPDLRQFQRFATILQYASSTSGHLQAVRGGNVSDSVAE
jgi:hypothetical protein